MRVQCRALRQFRGFGWGGPHLRIAKTYTPWNNHGRVDGMAMAYLDLCWEIMFLYKQTGGLPGFALPCWVYRSILLPVTVDGDGSVAGLVPK